MSRMAEGKAGKSIPLAPEPKEEVAGSSVHIDTSLQIEQQKIEAKAKPVRVALRAYAIRSTSSYARKEFKRAWLQDLHLIYVKAEGCGTITAVYDAIYTSTWHPQAKRRLARCLDAISAVLSPHPNLTLAAAVPRLRAHVAEAILGAYEAWARS